MIEILPREIIYIILDDNNNLTISPKINSVCKLFNEYLTPLKKFKILIFKYQQHKNINNKDKILHCTEYMGNIIINKQYECFNWYTFYLCKNNHDNKEAHPIVWDIFMKSLFICINECNEKFIEQLIKVMMDFDSLMNHEVSKYAYIHKLALNKYNIFIDALKKDHEPSLNIIHQYLHIDIKYHYNWNCYFYGSNEWLKQKLNNKQYNNGEWRHYNDEINELD